MRINRLVIQNVRNLEYVELETFGLINFFIGPNGSGKTSFLESISLLSLGRSFRTNNIASVIRHGADDLHVFCEIERDAGQLYRIGLGRNTVGKYSVRINGENISSLVPLSQNIPTLLFNSASFSLLEGGASHRAKFIDWGVFHVEHDFYNHWQSHKRNLKQRNALLKNRNLTYDQLLPWDAGLVESAAKIENLRVNYLREYISYFRGLCKQYDYKHASELTFFYQDGWGINKLVVDDNITFKSDDATYKAKLASNFERDKKMQRTKSHSGKADLGIYLDDVPIKDVMSRGQMKILITLLTLAQALYLKKITRKTPILLLDDLSSELDKENLGFLLDVFYSQNIQSFITLTDESQLVGSNNFAKGQMFHVKHGKIDTT